LKSALRGLLWKPGLKEGIAVNAKPWPQDMTFSSHTQHYLKKGISMIRLLYDTTIDGVRHGKGSMLTLDAETEAQLKADGDADSNLDFSGLSTMPALVGQRFAAASRISTNSASDAGFVTLASVTVPGELMRPNSKLVIISDWDCPSSASVKTFAVDFGGQNVGQPSLTTSAMLKLMTEIQNLNSLLSQKTMNGSSYGATGTPRIATSVDTSVAVTIDFKAKWNMATLSETLTLLGYSIWHYPGI
jgi:hypothetical protein